MVRGISAYRGMQQVLPKVSKTKHPKTAITDSTKKVANDLPKLVILPGVVAGTYAIVNTNSIKCGKGCDDFDCEWHVYTWP